VRILLDALSRISTSCYRTRYTTDVFVLPVFLIYLKKINDFCFLTNYLNIYRTNICQICRVGRTMAVDERPEVNFLISQQTLPCQPIFVGLVGFCPQNWVRAAFGRWRRTTRSASAVLDAGKPIN